MPQGAAATTATAAGRPRRRIVLLGAALLLAIPLFLPTLLSCGPGRPLLEFLLRQRIGLPVRLESAELGWAAPTSLTGLVIGSPDGFGEAPLLDARIVALDLSVFDWLFTSRAPHWKLTGASLDLVRAPDGEVNLRRALDRPAADPIGSFLDRGGHLECMESEVRITDRGNKHTTYLTDMEMRLHGSRSEPAGWFSASVEGPAGPGALELERSRSVHAADGQTLRVAARNVWLQGLAPLLAVFSDQSQLQGQLDLSLQLDWSEALVRFHGNGTAKNLSVAVPPWLALPASDSLLRFDGGFALDLESGSAEFERFSFSSSLAYIDANGAWLGTDGSWAGDLVLDAGAQLGRAMHKLGSLAGRVFPMRTLGGGVEIRLRPLEDDRFRLVVSGEALRSLWKEGRQFDIGDAHLAADLARTGRELRIDHAELSALAADVSGSGTIRLDGSQPAQVDLDLRLDAQLEKIHSLLYHGFGLTVPVVVSGEASTELHIHGDTGRLEFGFDARSPLFGFRYERPVGDGMDAYRFEIQPLTLKGTLGLAPLDDDPWAGLSAALSATAGRLKIDRNELVDCSLDLTHSDGVTRFTRFDANDAVGGSLRATGTAQQEGQDRPRLTIRAEARDLAMGVFQTRLAAVANPIFVHEQYPWNLETDSRLSGELDLRGFGSGTTEILTSLSGTGRLEISGGELAGSPLLTRLAPKGAPTGMTLAGAHSTLTFDTGSIRSVTSVEFLGRSRTSRGEADPDGRVDHVLGPEWLFEPAFLERFGDRIPPDLFRVRGRIDRPELVLPDPDEWRSLAEQGLLEDAILDFLNN